MNGITGRLSAVLVLAAALLLARDPGPSRAASTPRTETGVVNGTPRILVNGQDAIRIINQFSHLPTYSKADGSLVNDYRRGLWLNGVKQQIDQMSGTGANTLELPVWWAEMAEERTINFEPLDQAMKYAGQEGVFVILAPKVDARPPQWWVKANDFPDPAGIPCIPQEAGADHACIPREICAPGDPRCCSKPREELYCCTPIYPSAPNTNSPPRVSLTAERLPQCAPVADNPRYRTCSTCETDSYGWKYASPGWGGAQFQQDYGDFLKKLIARYRNDGALVGWLLALGPTGEDQYGPSRFMMRTIYGNVMGESLADQVTDYSDDAHVKFKEWIKGRYRSDDRLQQAWGAPGLTLQTVKLPDPRRLFTEGHGGLFPDNFFRHFFVELDALAQPGRDLYDFREAVRNQARSSFTKLFKELDRQHVLIYAGSNSDGIYADPAIDAVHGQHRIEYALNQLDEASLIAVLAALSTKHGKASLYILESAGRDGGGLVRDAAVPNTSGQKDALQHAAETVLCSGGYLGYTSEIAGAAAGRAWSSEDREILRGLASFAPSTDCVCQKVPSGSKVVLRRTVGELVDLLGLQGQYRCPRSTGTADSEPRTPDQHVPPSGQPVVPPAPASSGQARPYCGDGICDEFEKSHPGVCTKDCP